MVRRFGFCDTDDHEKCPVVIDVERQEGKRGGTSYRLHFECGCDCHQEGES